MVMGGETLAVHPRLSYFTFIYELEPPAFWLHRGSLLAYSMSTRTTRRICFCQTPLLTWSNVLQRDLFLRSHAHLCSVAEPAKID